MKSLPEDDSDGTYEENDWLRSHVGGGVGPTEATLFLAVGSWKVGTREKNESESSSDDDDERSFSSNYRSDQSGALDFGLGEEEDNDDDNGSDDDSSNASYDETGAVFGAGVPFYLIPVRIVETAGGRFTLHPSGKPFLNPLVIADEVRIIRHTQKHDSRKRHTVHVTSRL